MPFNAIVVKFKQNGLEYITVTDNGSGISDENLETLGEKDDFEELMFATKYSAF